MPRLANGTLVFQDLIEWGKEVEASPDPEWLVEHLIPLQAAVQISGPATVSFKTWFAMTTTLALASGKNCGGLKVNPALGPQPVAFVELEKPRKPTWNRWKWLMKGHGLTEADLGYDEAQGTLSRIHWIHMEPVWFDDPKHVRDIAKYIEHHKIRLLVIDTFAKAARVDENSVKEIRQVTEGFDRIRNTASHPAVMYIHHVRKRQDTVTTFDIDEETRGSGSLAGFYDVHIALRKQFKQQPTIDLTVRANDAEEKYGDICWHIDKDRQEAIMDLHWRDGQGISETWKDLCVTKLVPNETYTKEALKAVWGAQDKAAFDTLLRMLLGEGSLIAVGRKFKLS